MTVIVTEAVPDRLRGRLAVWMIELRAGVFVGNLSKRHRDHLWATVRDQVTRHQGNAAIAWSSNNEVGFEFDTVGPNRRIPVRLDGVSLVTFLPLQPDTDLLDDDLVMDDEDRAPEDPTE